MTPLVNDNGRIVTERQVCISPHNRSFKYGDGCFETIRLVNGTMPLLALHVDRLFSSLQTLQFSVPENFDRQFLHQQICSLAEANKHTTSAKIRLTVYRGENGLSNLTDNNLYFLIQSQNLVTSYIQFNETGYSIGFYPDARKSCDIFSSLKSNNYLPYAMAALWARSNHLDDCLLMNCHDRIADATIANLFIVSNGIIQTSLLSEGCVNGVMRRYLIGCFKRENITFTESPLTPTDILQASEVFLTNAVYGIKWVKKIEDQIFANKMSASFYKQFITPINEGSIKI